MNSYNFKKFVVTFLLLLTFVFFVDVILQQRSEAARAYQYKVISIQGMTELRTQQNTAGGRLASIEKVINDQTAGGWEFIQADGYVLYFRK